MYTEKRLIALRIVSDVEEKEVMDLVTATAPGKGADLNTPSWKRGADAMAEATRLIHAFMLDSGKAQEYRDYIDRVEIKLVDDPAFAGGACFTVLVVAARQIAAKEATAHKLEDVCPFPGFKNDWGRKLAELVQAKANRAIKLLREDARSHNHHEPHVHA